MSQFDEDEALSTFERWLVHLDYRSARSEDPIASRHKELGIAVLNALLPEGAEFDEVTLEGRIRYRVGGRSVPTISLSDGYRSILAMAGDLIWRLLQAFPSSQHPHQEEGVVLIDELDIHLHPAWQREIAGWLRRQFPNLQFIVATHSPMVAAGAGSDALTLRFRLEDGKTRVDRVENISAMSVDRILQSRAFGLVSSFSPETQQKIDRYDDLVRKGKRRTEQEEKELDELSAFLQEARPLGGPPEPGSLEARIEAYLDGALK
jgi:hypothetical protein